MKLFFLFFFLYCIPLCSIGSNKIEAVVGGDQFITSQEVENRVLAFNTWSGLQEKIGFDTALKMLVEEKLILLDSKKIEYLLPDPFDLNYITDVQQRKSIESFYISNLLINYIIPNHNIFVSDHEIMQYREILEHSSEVMIKIQSGTYSTWIKKGDLSLEAKKSFIENGASGLDYLGFKISDHILIPPLLMDAEIYISVLDDCNDQDLFKKLIASKSIDEFNDLLYKNGLKVNKIRETVSNLDIEIINKVALNISEFKVYSLGSKSLFYIEDLDYKNVSYYNHEYINSYILSEKFLLEKNKAIQEMMSKYSVVFVS